MGLAAVIGLPHSAAKQADEGWAVAEEAPLAVTADIILQGAQLWTTWTLVAYCHDICCLPFIQLLDKSVMTKGTQSQQP